MIKFLKTSRGRRIAILFGVCIVLTLVTVDYVLLPQVFPSLNQPTVASAISDTLHAILVIFIANIAVLALLMYVYPLRDDVNGVEVTHPHKTLDLHNRALENTEFWWHNGHFGRWVRSKVFPTFEKASREKRKRHDVTLILLNPSNIELCRRYAEYRNSTRQKGRANRWGVQDVRSEIYATIYSANKYHVDNSRLDINVYLKEFFSIFRRDICSDYVFRTTEDPNHPSVVYANDSLFYTLEENELEETKMLSSKNIDVGSYKQVAGDNFQSKVASFFDSVELGISSNDSRIIERTVECLKDTSIPYENMYAGVKY